MEKESESFIEAPKVGGRISRCMVIDGGLKSCEPIIIDGTVNGDIRSDDTVLISKSGIVHGKVEAKAIILQGFCEGPLEATNVEITKDAQLVGYILASNAKVSGSVDGDILAREFLEVTNDARIVSYETISKRVVVKGLLQGEVTAKELLEIYESGTIEGDVKVKELQAHGPGKIFGSISRIRADEADTQLSQNYGDSKQEEHSLKYG